MTPGTGTDTLPGERPRGLHAAAAFARKSASAGVPVLVALATLTALGACRGREAGPRVSSTARGSVGRDSARVVINEVMANPRVVPDERGEWLEVYNWGSGAASLRGWTIASGGDAPHRIGANVRVPASGHAVLARAAANNGGVLATYVYGSALALANDADWLALRDASGRTVDSVAWTSAPNGAARGVRDPSRPHARAGGDNWVTQIRPYGAGDRGTPGAANEGSVPGAGAPIARAPRTPAAPAAGVDSVGGGGRDTLELVVQLLDVGQGDAVYIANGASRILVDGGVDPERLGRHLDRLGLNGGTVDVVVISHAHADHYNGLRALFESRRGIRVRYVFENKDPSPNATLADLRDSVLARQRRDGLVYRDTDDPCANGRPICTLTLRGGAKLHVLRPHPSGAEVSTNDRSAALKLVGPDSASFTMWLAGDAEHEAMRAFQTAGYATNPGMRVRVLKANHHGSCNGVTPGYLDATRPEWVAVSLGRENTYGHMHEQAKAAYARAGLPWYRTDQNGTITFRSPGRPGGGYTVTVGRGLPTMTGRTDRRSTQEDCR